MSCTRSRRACCCGGGAPEPLLAGAEHGHAERRRGRGEGLGGEALRRAGGSAVSLGGGGVVVGRGVAEKVHVILDVI